MAFYLFLILYVWLPPCLAGVSTSLLLRVLSFPGSPAYSLLPGYWLFSSLLYQWEVSLCRDTSLQCSKKIIPQQTFIWCLKKIKDQDSQGIIMRKTRFAMATWSSYISSTQLYLINKTPLSPCVCLPNYSPR